MSTVARKLEAMRLNDVNARKVFDALLSNYETNREEVTVDRMRQLSGVRPRALREVFKQLERLELGELIFGRHGHQTRFVWRVKFQETLPGPLKGEARNADALPALDAKGANVLTQWVCSLGPRRHAQVLLPSNASRKDLVKLRNFLDKQFGLGTA